MIKIEQIKELTKELGYKFGKTSVLQYPFEYEIRFNAVRFGENGEVSVLFHTLDEVIKYLKEKRSERIKRKVKKS